MWRRPIVLASTALLGLLLAQPALASHAGLAPVNPNSPQAARIESVYWLLISITGAIFVLVEGALVLFIFRFRNRGRSRTLEGPQLHGATRLELIWTAIPIVILVGVVTFVLYKLPGINTAHAADSAAKPLTVQVEGHQFYWNFIYPNGVIQVETMTIPTRRRIKLRIDSQDVVHSWWIPSLQGKFDAIPGKTNHTQFVALRTGHFEGQCGEFCGYEHPQMLATVHAVRGGGFDGWLAAQGRAQANGTSNLGEMTFRGVCATCHGFQGQGGIGPNLQGNPTITQPAAIRTLLENGLGKMPPVGRGWTDRQMNALIAYLKKLPNGSSSGG